MKFLSVFLIALYLLLPVACLAHPCAGQGTAVQAQALDLTPIAAAESPESSDPDDCKTTCCCAGCLPFTLGRGPTLTAATGKKAPHHPSLVLPRVLDRIFVPPQISP